MEGNLGHERSDIELTIQAFRCIKEVIRRHSGRPPFRERDWNSVHPPMAMRKAVHPVCTTQRLKAPSRHSCLDKRQRIETQSPLRLQDSPPPTDTNGLQVRTARADKRLLQSTAPRLQTQFRLLVSTSGDADLREKALSCRRRQEDLFLSRRSFRCSYCPAFPANGEKGAIIVKTVSTGKVTHGEKRGSFVIMFRRSVRNRELGLVGSAWAMLRWKRGRDGKWQGDRPGRGATC